MVNYREYINEKIVAAVKKDEDDSLLVELEAQMARCNGFREIFAGLEKFRHSSYPIENHTTIRTETFGLKVSGKGDAKICLKNSVGQKLKIYVTDTKITVDRTMAGYKEFSEHFMTEKYSISTAARKKDGAWNLELVFDVSILELFAEDGVDAISTVVYPETPYDRVSWKGDLSVELYEIDA